MARRPCLKCGKPSADTYCDRCKPRPQPGSTTDRGLGADHQRRRRELLPAAIGTHCPLCEDIMLPDDELALHHTVPRSRDRSSAGDAIAHAECNMIVGNRTPPSPEAVRRARRAMRIRAGKVQAAQ